MQVSPEHTVEEQGPGRPRSGEQRRACCVKWFLQVGGSRKKKKKKVEIGNGKCRRNGREKKDENKESKNNSNDKRCNCTSLPASTKATGGKRSSRADEGVRGGESG